MKRTRVTALYQMLEKPLDIPCLWGGGWFIPSVSDSYLTRTWMMWTTFKYTCPPKSMAYNTSQIWSQFRVRNPHSPLRRHTFHLSVAASLLNKLPNCHKTILTLPRGWQAEIPDEVEFLCTHFGTVIRAGCQLGVLHTLGGTNVAERIIVLKCAM